MSVLLVVVGLSALVLIHEGGHAAMARALGMRITDLSIGLGPAWATRRWGRAMVRFGLIPFGGYVRVAELSPKRAEEVALDVRSTLSRLAVIAGGSFGNYLVAATLGVVSAATWGVETGAMAGLEVTAVSASAREVGLQTGDLLVAVDGRPVTRVAELGAGLRAAAGRQAQIEVHRRGEPVVLSARPIERRGRWGLGARYVTVPELRQATLGDALGEGLTMPISTAGRLLRNAAEMVVPGSAVRPLSPVGLADRVARSGRWDARRVVGFAALLSVVVGLFNLLPVPGLDGGRVLIELGQAVARRPLGRRLAVGLQIAGALLLLLVWLAVFAADLWTLGR